MLARKSRNVTQPLYPELQITLVKGNDGTDLTMLKGVLADDLWCPRMKQK